ncbi:hypothetical protein ACHQM5_020645 [Ranunculus cassubicifolius]
MGSTYNTRFPMSYFFKLVDKLSENQRNIIMKTGFGYLLEMHSQTLSKSLILELMERWHCEKKAFELPPGDVKIKLIDVALILGLRVTGERVVLKKNFPRSTLEDEYGATITERSISVLDLEKRLKSFKPAASEDFVADKKRAEDFVRSFLLFTFGAFLFPNDCGTVDSRYLYFLEDVDKIPQFSWGKVLREQLYEWMSKFKKDKDLRYMGGCLIFLQLWSFEHIDIARPNIPDSFLTFPRACRWQNSSSRPRKWVTSKFEELKHNQIVWSLEPNSEESRTDVIRDYLDMQNRINELSTTPEPSTADTTDLGDNVEDVTMGLQEHVIELDDSESAVDDENRGERTTGLREEVIKSDNSDVDFVIELQDGVLNSSNYDSSLDSAGYVKLKSLEETEIEKIKKENRMLNKVIDELREEIRTLRSQHMEETEIEKIKKENRVLNKVIDELREEIRTLRSQHMEETEIEKLKKENRMLNKVIDELREENRTLRSQHMSTESFADRMENLISQYENGTLGIE